MIRALRAWARTHTERNRYSPVGIAFHWIMALLVMIQLGWGYYTSWLPAGGDKLAAYQVHSAIGLPILLLAVGRFGWRLMIPGPVNDADRQGWQTQIAYLIHYVFYVAFFGLPLSGWAMWSSVAEPGPLRLAGILPWPPLPFDQLPLTMRWQIMSVAEDVHHVLVITLLLVIPLHVGAALKHHFWDHHDVLQAMLPEIEDAPSAQAASKHRPREMPPPRTKAPG